MLGICRLSREEVIPAIDVSYDELLGRAYGLLREDLIEQASFAAMDCWITRVERVDMVGRSLPDLVGLGPRYVGLNVVDIPERRRRLEGDRIRSHADRFPYENVQSP